MEKPDIPPELKAQIKKHLGKNALNIQMQSQTIGLWVITSDNKARYFPFDVFLNELVKDLSVDEKQFYIDEMAQLDIETECMVVFVLSETEQFVCRVNVFED